MVSLLVNEVFAKFHLKEDQMAALEQLAKALELKKEKAKAIMVREIINLRANLK